MSREIKHAGASATRELSSANPEVVSKPKLFDTSIVSGPQEAVSFIINILESSTEYSVIGKDLGGTILLWNEGARRIYGYEPSELIGKANSSILHVPEDVKAGKPQEIMDAALRDGKWEGTIDRRRKNGEQFTARVVITPRRDASGRPVGFLLISKDISAEIQMDQVEITRTEAELVQLRKAVNTSGEVIFMTNREGVFTYVNPEFTRFYGYTQEDVIGKTTPRVLKSGLVLPDSIASLWKALVDKQSLESEMINKTKDGRLVAVENSANPILDDHGNITGFLAIQRDITEHKRALETLAVSETRFRRLFEAAKDGILILDAGTGEIIDVNPFLTNLLGYSRQGLMGKHLWEIGALKDKVNSQDSFRLLQENEYIRYDDLPLETIHGKRVDVEFVSNAYWNGKQKVIQCNIRDITELKRKEKELQKVAERLNLSLDCAHMGTWEWNFEEDRVTWGPRQHALFGIKPGDFGGTFTEFIGRLHPDDREHTEVTIKAALANGRIFESEYRIVWPDGSVHTLAARGAVHFGKGGRPDHMSGISWDITARKDLEEKLRQSQKMEAVGQLAGGVAHDFNNLLTVINGYSEVMLQQLKPENPHWKYVAEVKKAGDRAAALTRQLLAFSRRQVLVPQVLDLNQVIANMDPMLRRLIGEDIELTSTPGKNLGRVKADSSQMEQVILNLAVNARDAMRRGGKLTIETANVELDESYAANHITAKPGPHVMLAVSDTGTGMDAETQERIFEPFFTTKEAGKGTGLGLSTVYGIVKQTDGQIWVYSELGRGTTFKIYLPRVDAPVKVTGSTDARVELPRGTETILIVEDEPSVRMLVRASLESNGYQVLEAANGTEAILTAEKHQAKIDLLLTDLVMPGIGGRALAEQMATRRPEAKVLYTSGYTDDTAIRHGGRENGTAFIQKPFSPRTLVEKVREVLDSRRGPE